MKEASATTSGESDRTVLKAAGAVGRARAGAIADAPPGRQRLGAATQVLRVRGPRRAGHVPGARHDGRGPDRHRQLLAAEHTSRLRPRQDVLAFVLAQCDSSQRHYSVFVGVER